MFDNYAGVTAKKRDGATSGLCTCLHANIYVMETDGYPLREDWPFGPELERRRLAAGLAQREAARRTAPSPGAKPMVSAGRWKQLETGWQKNKGVLIPIGTTPATVAAVARVVDWDVSEALTIAGFDPTDSPAAPSNPLGRFSDADLLAEVQRRFDLAARAVENHPKPE